MTKIFYQWRSHFINIRRSSSLKLSIAPLSPYKNVRANLNRNLYFVYSVKYNQMFEVLSHSSGGQSCWACTPRRRGWRSRCRWWWWRSSLSSSSRAGTWPVSLPPSYLTEAHPHSPAAPAPAPLCSLKTFYIHTQRKMDKYKQIIISID